MSRNFVIRTIRDGAVKINGFTYQPLNLSGYGRITYDGRLDGMRYAFGLYWVGDKQEPYVFLWGTERAYRSELKDDWPGPHCVGGYFQWDFWYRQQVGG